MEIFQQSVPGIPLSRDPMELCMWCCAAAQTMGAQWQFMTAAQQRETALIVSATLPAGTADKSANFLIKAAELSEGSFLLALINEQRYENMMTVSEHMDDLLLTWERAIQSATYKPAGETWLHERRKGRIIGKVAL